MNFGNTTWVTLLRSQVENLYLFLQNGQPLPLPFVVGYEPPRVLEGVWIADHERLGLLQLVQVSEARSNRGCQLKNI